MNDKSYQNVSKRVLIIKKMDKKQTAMTPKEKAQELVNKYYTNNDLPLQTLSFIKSKQCALIAVDEIIKTLPQSEYLEDRLEMVENRELIYWKQVKQEIEKL